MSLLAPKSGAEDRDRSTLWTSPWRWRTEDSLYVGHNKQVWMYRELPLSPLQWEDPDVRLQVGAPLNNLLDEIGSTSKGLGGGMRSLARNREVHLLAIT